MCILVAAMASSCENITSQSSCTSSKDSCAWCTSGAVGASCMDAADAAGLPSSVFTCTTSASTSTEAVELGRHSNKGSGGGGNSGDPTMYVFAYSWTPGFCNTQSNDPGCESPEAYWGSHFTVHGLWPQYTTTGYPADCTTEPFDPKSPEAVGITNMEKYWPNVQAAEGSSDYDDFWTHEWTKHGTCSGLKQTDYFNTTMSLAMTFGTPSIFTDNVGKSVPANDLRSALGGATKASLICSNGQLTGAYTCWSQVNGYPTVQATCPSSVQSEDTCTSSSVLVVGF